MFNPLVKSEIKSLVQSLVDTDEGGIPPQPPEAFRIVYEDSGGILLEDGTGFIVQEEAVTPTPTFDVLMENTDKVFQEDATGVIIQEEAT